MSAAYFRMKLDRGVAAYNRRRTDLQLRYFELQRDKEAGKPVDPADLQRIASELQSMGATV